MVAFSVLQNATFDSNIATSQGGAMQIIGISEIMTEYVVFPFDEAKFSFWKPYRFSGYCLKIPHSRVLLLGRNTTNNVV